MTDVMMRNETTGQFESTSRAAIADDYVRDRLGVAFEELLDTYESVQTSIIGRMMFA